MHCLLRALLAAMWIAATISTFQGNKMPCLRLQSSTLVTSAGQQSFASQPQETGQKSLRSLSGILVQTPSPIFITNSLFHDMKMRRALLYHAAPAAPPCLWNASSSPVMAYGCAGRASILCGLFEDLEITSARAFLGRAWCLMPLQPGIAR